MKKTKFGGTLLQEYKRMSKCFVKSIYIETKDPTMRDYYAFKTETHDMIQSKFGNKWNGFIKGKSGLNELI